MSLASCIACWKRRQYVRRKLETKEEPTKKEEEEGEPDLSKLPRTKEPTIEEIVNQVGICENPILARRRHGGLACIVCKKQVPQKWETCQKIQTELKTSPVAYHKFLKSVMEKITEERKVREDPYWWWEAPKTEDMTLEEIEEKLGLRQLNPLIPQELFDAIKRRYHQICESCEEHIKYRCTRYCKEFWQDLPSEMKTQALQFKGYRNATVKEKLGML